MTKRQLHCVFCDKSHESKDCFLAQNWSSDKKKEAISNKKAYVLDQLCICGKTRLKRGLWNKELREKEICIADYGEGSPEIELLIGADFFGQPFTGRIHKLECGLIAYETYIGWVLMGRT
ncbi:hypothetical protein TNIN_333221 [Trichonephila inaurata madagascariensis]|uniref:Peptidase aspartic putative domain-containing protein n=1 Tax=Trichonephila inaurata madagascariensis TaxID=2747483 RepID=A0A8X6Y0L9_9ARAC|nr:hypothetical protein TNIN_333221 [Trichonephila inaurata madagascariensis]